MKTKEVIQVRPMFEICKDIRKDWKVINFGAKPYFDAMQCLNSVNESYGYDSGKSIVLYFLSNASSWKGDKAKEIKAELKAMIK